MGGKVFVDVVHENIFFGNDDDATSGMVLCVLGTFLEVSWRI